MRKRDIPIVAVTALFLLTGCNGDKTDAVNTGTQDGMISLNGGGTAVSLSQRVTRAAPGFPNDGKIGVVAAYYDSTGVDWTSYADISNTSATAMTLSDTTYFFEWDTDPVKYWPFDGTELVFMAYSPVAGTRNNMLLSTDNSHLFLSLDDDMPDVLYASANATAAKTPYSKLSPSPVYLGQFRHALSQVVVELVIAPGIGDIEITHLSLITYRRNANFTLEAGDEGLLVDDEDSMYEYIFISENTIMPAGSSLSRSRYLYPGTEDYTSVSIGLLGPGGDPLDMLYPMFFFQSTDPLHLERAKRTTLRIYVNGNTVSNPSEVIDLKGVLSDWDQRGNFGMTIN